MQKKIICILFILCFIIFFFNNCSKSTDPDNTITVSGTVTLEDRIDHSGVKVSLYKPVELDTALVRINQQYPNIGVQISQETEFDHREHVPLYSTTTNTNGSWEIEGVSPGKYNVVAEKDSFGWKYINNITEYSNIDFDALKRILYLDGVIIDNLNIIDGFVRLENATIPSNIQLNVTGNSVVIISGNSDLNVEGQFNVTGTQNEFIKITCELPSQWRAINIKSGAKSQLSHCILKDGKNGVYNKSSDFSFNMSIAKNHEIAIENIMVTDSITVDGNLFKNNEIAIHNTNVLNVLFINNLFFNNKESIIIKSSAYSKIQRNIFHKDSIAININPHGGEYSHSNSSINNCIFQNNKSSIYFGSLTSGSEGKFNNFYCIENNFITIHGGSAEPDTLNFRENYWGIFTEQDIKNKIFDKEDSIENYYYCDVNNFLFSPYNF